MGPRYVRLLEEIDRRGSIREACACIGLSYRICLNRVRQMERVLGHPVIHTTRGGASGGGSGLTDEA
jgi:molybdate transport repressor ModE-like protein